MDDGYNLSTRMRAELSMNIIASTRPFTLSENGKKMHVCVERKEPSAPLYVTDVTGKKEGVPAVHILINTNSDAFKFAKNPPVSNCNDCL